MNNRRYLTTGLCMAALFALNACILARVFHTEYTPFMGSIEGAYVGISRWLQTNWSHPGWFPLWYGGIPIENFYPPLLHFLVAFASMATGASVAHAHHAVTATFYCLCPVALFWLVWRLTKSRWQGFIAGWLYSLVSPSAFLLRSVREDLGSAWGGRKIQTLLVYGDSPHIASITLLVVALAAVHAALESRLGWRTVVAVVAAAAVALTNWLGALALVCGVLALLIARKDGRLGRIALIGVLAYAIAIPWIPPSDIATVQRNSQLVGAYPMGHAQYFYLVAWVAGAFGIGFGLKRTSMPEAGRFALVFLFLMAVPPLGSEWFHVYPLPQPDRYHLEMGLALAIVAGIVLGSGKLASNLPRAVVIALLLCLAVVQVPRWRAQVRGYLPSFDITKTVEREQALWLGSHYPGQRVFVAGSTRFWFNAFADNPQLGGGFDQGRSNPAIAGVTYAIPYLQGNGPDTVALLKAYGVRAVAVGGKGSRDAYRDYNDPEKFAGVVPEVWRDGSDAIYEIPGTGSLAHVVRKEELVIGSLFDWPALRLFAAGLDRNDGHAQMNWNGPNHASIQVELTKPEVVSVQVSWDPGWRASLNGAALAIHHDALGLMVLEPNCEGRCAIDLVYDGGVQGKIADLLCITGFGVCGYLIFRRNRRGAPEAVETTPAPVAPYPLYLRAIRVLLRWLNRSLPEWPAEADASRFDPERLRQAEAALRGMKMPDADGDRYLAKHVPRLSKTLALAPPPQKTGRVLELGCYMQITPLLQRVCGYTEVRGAYYGPTGKIDRKTFDFPDGQFTCYVDHFDVEREEFPYPDDYFDLVVAGEIVEHMTYDPMWMLLEARRVLADGGYLLISTPNVGSVTSAAKTLDGRDNPQIFFLYERPGPDNRTDIGHVREYTFHELGEAVRAAGFEIELHFTTFIEEFSEHRQLLRFLALNGYDTENRGEQTWCLARKRAALPVDRYPWFIYTP